MTEQNNTQEQNPQPSSEGKLFSGVLWVIIFAGLIYFVFQKPEVAWKIALVAVGFGAVVMVHELGHFIVAKLCGIKIEAFAIGFPPILLGIRKTSKGFRFRFLPGQEPENNAGGEDLPTEYCIGALPFGGYVKMMGQSDTGSVEKTNDPRSYLNKPIWQRILVVAAGVVFNAIGAMILYMALFMHGLELSPALIGDVIPQSPADVAGLSAGDRIQEIDGETFIDFTTVMLSAALSDKDRTVSMKVQKADGSVHTVNLKAEKQYGDPSGLRAFGIEQPSSARISRYEKNPAVIEEMFKLTGFCPGDEITAVDNKQITQPWQLNGAISAALTPKAMLTVSRSYPAGSAQTAQQVPVELFCSPRLENFRTEFDLAHVYSMVPRLKALAVTTGPSDAASGGWMQKLLNRILGFFGKKSDPVEKKAGFEEGDIIVKIGDVENPTYKDLREQTIASKDKPLHLTVLRKNAEGVLSAVSYAIEPTAKPGEQGRVTLGIVPALDMDHAVVARTIDSVTGPSSLQIPAGAAITKVDGHPVASFYDVVAVIRKNSGQHISIDYVSGDTAGCVGLDVPEQDAIHLRSNMLTMAPMENLKETYKASGPWQGIIWGIKRTGQFVMQSVMTLGALFTRDVPMSSLSGPVGIATISYKMAGQGIIDLLNFMGLLSSCLAVMNLLPLPIVDGGVIVLLLIEKIRGVPLSQKTQEIITWVGLVFLLSVFVWVTYNDTLRVIFGK